MKDMIFLSTIIVFWFLLTFSLTYVYADELVLRALAEGNSSYVITLNQSEYNFTSGTSDASPTVYQTTGGWWSMVGRIFTFRIPVVEQIPIGLTLFISFINYFLLTIMGLLIYRLIRSGAG